MKSSIKRLVTETFVKRRDRSYTEKTREEVRPIDFYKRSSLRQHISPVEQPYAISVKM